MPPAGKPASQIQLFEHLVSFISKCNPASSRQLFPNGNNLCTCVLCDFYVILKTHIFKMHKAQADSSVIITKRTPSPPQCHWPPVEELEPGQSPRCPTCALFHFLTTYPLTRVTTVLTPNTLHEFGLLLNFIEIGM